jgi:uncharacterized protein (TIGR03067 family)
VLIDPLAEPEEKVANDEVDPIVYGPVKGNGARDMYTRSSKLEEKVEVEGLALGDGSPDQRVVYDRCMIVVRGVDFKELKASGRPVRVKGTVGRSGGTLVRLRNPEGGYTSTRLPAYYYIEASSLELIDRVTVPRLVAPVAPKAPVGKKDLERLQGVWTITSLEIGGEKLPDETARALSVGVGYTFGPEKVTLVGQVSQKDGQFFIRDGTQVFPYRIDPATKEIDIRTKNKESAKGIYKFDGDDLILCIDFSRAERPATFGTKDKPAYELYRLKKQR